MNVTARTTKAIALSSFVGASVLAAPLASAEPSAPSPATAVSASVHLDYTVSGMTATLRPSASGTQHISVAAEDGQPMAFDHPVFFELKTPASVTVSGGSTVAQSSLSCTDQGSVPLSSDLISGEPVVLTFPRPGTYAVTLHATVCAEPEDRTETVRITIPATTPAHPGHPGQPTHPAHPGTGTPAPSAPVTPPTKPGAGPRVETDGATSGDSTSPLGLAALMGLGLLGGGVVARRHATRS